MTETQAKSGGSSTTPVEEEPKADRPAPAGREASGYVAPPTDAPSPPKFTRAPGMAPPPGEPPAENDGSSDPKPHGGPGAVKGSATVPILTKGKGAQPGAAPGRNGAVPPGKPGAAGAWRRRWCCRAGSRSRRPAAAGRPAAA